mgnify:CR=1 FL=1
MPKYYLCRIVNGQRMFLGTKAVGGERITFDSKKAAREYLRERLRPHDREDEYRIYSLTEMKKMKERL